VALSAPLTAGISVPQIDGSEPSKSSWKPGANSASCAARDALTPLSSGVMTRDAAPRWRSADPTGWATKSRAVSSTPMCRPSTPSGSATSVRTSSASPRPLVTRRARPATSQP
jgi:hypothetical protein